MAFLKELKPEHGQVLPVIGNIARIVAGNPSVMTYHGTNTYLISIGDRFAILDPGPDDAAHVDAILAATDGRIDDILFSHAHRDHVGALARLKATTGAAVHGFRQPVGSEFAPDVVVADGDKVLGMTAIHTPGHAADHLCFARPDGVLFSADHVMGWSSSIVSPPGGNMADYFASLKRMLARGDAVYLPGHGPMIRDPHPYVADLLRRRLKREREIEMSLRTHPRTAPELVSLFYKKNDVRLLAAAERNVFAHLDKLAREGAVRQDGDRWYVV